MERTLSATIDLKNQMKVDKYITDIDDGGITIHPENMEEVSSYLQLDGTGVYINDISGPLSSFSKSGAIIGKSDVEHIEINSLGIIGKDGVGSPSFLLGFLDNQSKQDITIGLPPAHGYENMKINIRTTILEQEVTVPFREEFEFDSANVNVDAGPGAEWSFSNVRDPENCTGFPGSSGVMAVKINTTNFEYGVPSSFIASVTGDYSDSNTSHGTATYYYTVEYNGEDKIIITHDIIIFNSSGYVPLMITEVFRTYINGKALMLNSYLRLGTDKGDRGAESATIGTGLYASNNGQLSIGAYNENDGNVLLSIGGGTSTDPKTVFSVDKTGSIFLNDGRNLFTAIRHNGNNLWIGANGNTDHYSHTGCTYISIGNEVVDNKSIRVSIPDQAGGASTNYYVLHNGYEPDLQSISITSTTGIADAYYCYKFGKVIQLNLSITKNSATPSGNSIFEGTINTNTLRPIDVITGGTYYGARSIMGTINKAGKIVVRNTHSDSLPAITTPLNISFIYLIA